MKRIVLLFGIIVLSMVSCSTDDINTPIENAPKKFKSFENSDFSITARDSLTRDNDSISDSGNPKPIKP